jgi:hypothetical protein
VSQTTVQLRYNEGVFSACDEPQFKTMGERLEDLLNQNPNVSKGTFTDLAVAQGIAQKDVLGVAGTRYPRGPADHLAQRPQQAVFGVEDAKRISSVSY